MSLSIKNVDAKLYFNLYDSPNKLMQTAFTEVVQKLLNNFSNIFVHILWGAKIHIMLAFI